jgi:hypothetical protein
VVDVAFTINPNFAIVAVQFKRTSVMLVGVLFVGNDDRVASTIGLEVNAKEGGVARIHDAKDTPIPDGFEHLNLSTDTVKYSHIYARDVLWLVDMGHFSRF